MGFRGGLASPEKRVYGRSVLASVPPPHSASPFFARSSHFCTMQSEAGLLKGNNEKKSSLL